MATGRRSRDGYILVAVLSVMLLLTGFVAAGSLLVRSALDSAKVSDADVRMAGLTRGGLELTAYQLFVVKLPMSAVDGRSLRFAGGTIQPAIVDEGGKVDLNGADSKLLASLFASVGIGGSDIADMLARIVEIRGKDATPSATANTAPGGALLGAAAGGIAPPPVTAPAAAPAQQKRRGFQSVDQIRDLPGLTQADLRALTPKLTVYNPDGKVDILTASPDVLMAIPGLTKPKVEEILQHREGATNDEVSALTSLVQDAAPYIKTEAGPAYGVRIDATAAGGRKKAINAVVAASKSPNDPYYVLDWWE